MLISTDAPPYACLAIHAMASPSSPAEVSNGCITGCWPYVHGARVDIDHTHLLSYRLTRTLFHVEHESHGVHGPRDGAQGSAAVCTTHPDIES